MTDHEDRWTTAAVLNAETRAHLAAIDKAAAETRELVRGLVTEVADMKTDLHARDAVNAALVEASARAGAKKLSRLQNGFLILGGLVGLAGIVLAVVQSL